jgi:hypothetical protein
MANASIFIKQIMAAFYGGLWRAGSVTLAAILELLLPQLESEKINNLNKKTRKR